MKHGKLMQSDYANNLNASIIHISADDDNNCRSNCSAYSGSPARKKQLSPYIKSPWTTLNSSIADAVQNGLIGSLVRKEGRIYSLATYGELLYTGSDSKNVRVWKNLKQFSGFKSSSGLVKSIVISNGVVFTGHQDGKIRLWQVSYKNPTSYISIGTLPSLKDSMKKSFNPKNFVEVRRGRRNVLKIKHFDAVSCLCLNHEDGDYDNDNEEALLLYSGSWDKTVKVWRVSDSECIESIDAHDDAVNAVAVSGYDGLVLTGSADGTVKVWRREILNGSSRQRRVVTKHNLIRVLLEQESAITSLAVDKATGVTYCGSSDGLVNFWKRDQSGWFVHGGVLRGHKLAVLCMAVGGYLVISGSADKNICVWRREFDGGHTCLSVLTGHTGPVKCLAMVQDNSYYTKRDYNDHSWIIYSGSMDKSVNVWRAFEQNV